jgi:hypothetical protein
MGPTVRCRRQCRPEEAQRWARFACLRGWPEGHHENRIRSLRGDIALDLRGIEARSNCSISTDPARLRGP